MVAQASASAVMTGDAVVLLVQKQKKLDGVTL